METENPAVPESPSKPPRRNPGVAILRWFASLGSSILRYLVNLGLDLAHLIVAIGELLIRAVFMIGRAFRVSFALIKGHSITLRYFFKPKVTLMYPFERPQVAPYYRGRHYQVVEEETGRLRCDGCTLCAKICPTSVIDVIGIGKGENKIPKHYTLNLVACVFCGMCVDVCPEDAIKMVREFELAGPWRPDAYEHRGDRPLVLNLEDMMIYESAIYPDGRTRNKHMEEDIAKHVRLERERASKAGGAVAV